MAVSRNNDNFWDQFSALGYGDLNTGVTRGSGSGVVVQQGVPSLKALACKVWIGRLHGELGFLSHSFTKAATAKSSDGAPVTAALGGDDQSAERVSSAVLGTSGQPSFGCPLSFSSSAASATSVSALGMNETADSSSSLQAGARASATWDAAASRAAVSRCTIANGVGSSSPAAITAAAVPDAAAAAGPAGAAAAAAAAGAGAVPAMRAETSSPHGISSTAQHRITDMDSSSICCDVCFERDVQLRLQACRHALCAPCTRALLDMHASLSQAPRCPFCQNEMKGFTAMA